MGVLVCLSVLEELIAFNPPLFIKFVGFTKSTKEAQRPVNIVSFVPS